MIHPGLAALEKWDTIEYAAGYRARLAAIPDSEIAHHCWRCGWEDADTEALELDRHKRVLADGGEDAYAETWGLLFDAGGDARANGVRFDEGRTQPLIPGVKCSVTLRVVIGGRRQVQGASSRFRVHSMPVDATRPSKMFADHICEV